MALYEIVENKLKELDIEFQLVEHEPAASWRGISIRAAE